MSRLTGCSSSSLDDASDAEESSVANHCHVIDVDAEETEVKNSSAALPTSVAADICDRHCRCRICGEDFSNKSTKILHLHDKHSAADKCYKCGSCYKSFPSSQQLTQHMLVHTNVRRYQCQFCDKAFKQLSHVQQHERIHTGELPYHCPVSSCDRSFRQLSSMKQHLKGHGTSFVTSSNFSSASSSLPSSSEAGSCTTLSPKITTESTTLKKESPTTERVTLKEESPTTERVTLKEESPTADGVTLKEESPRAVTSLRYQAADSSCSSFRSLRAVACSSEPENSVESSHVNDEGQMPSRHWHETTSSITPLYQQSLIDLSSKLGEIKRRQRRLRLRTTILP